MPAGPMIPRRAGARVKSPGWLVPAGQRVRGACVTIRPVDTHWDTMWAAFDWEGWLKPQIDLCAARGYNTFCTFGGINGTEVGTELYTEAQLEARVRQVMDYVRQVGMWNVFVAGGRGSWDNSGSNPQITSSQWRAYCASMLANVLADFEGNLIGLDADLEVNAHTNEGAGLTPSFSWASVLADYDAVRAARTSSCPWLPMTMSNSVTPAGSGFQATFATDLATRVDFWNWHIYGSDPAAGYMVPVFSLGGSKPFLIGEFGVSVSMSQAARQNRVNAILTNVAGRDSQCVGTLQWCTFDQDTDPTNQWGIWDNPDDQTYRADVGDIFDSFPKAG